MDSERQRLVRRTALGSEAVYRVLARDGGLVELEVVSAPGLEPGMRLKVTQRALAAMEQLESAPVTAPSPRPAHLAGAPESG